jgi:hypothetical protein
VPTWQIDDLGANGTRRPVSDEAALRGALEELGQLEPRVVTFDINDYEYMHIGIGGRWAFVEYVVLEPWKAEVARAVEFGVEKPSSLRFLTCGASDTEILAKYLMPLSEAIELVVSFFRHGAPPDTVQWELV